MLKEPPTEPRQEPPMMRDYRLAAVVAVVLIVALLAAACAASRQVQGSVGSATPEPAMATRVAAAQAQADATRQAVATSAAVIDATAGAQNTATAAAQTVLMNATVSPATTTSAQPTPLTATPVPEPTARPAPTFSPTPDSLVYTANFATWDAGLKGAPYPARLSFDDATKEYRIALMDANRAYAYQVYAPDTYSFTDFQLDIDAQRIAGPDNGSYGVLFRIQPRAAGDKANADYAFLVHPDEEYFALNLLMADGTGKNIGKGTASAIKQGNATNHLTVICRANKVTLAINGQTVGTYPTTLLTGGAIGLVVSSPPAPSGPVGMEAAFAHLRVSPAPAP